MMTHLPRNVSVIHNADKLSRDEALAFANSGEWAFDIETFPNYFLVMFYRKDGTVLYFDTRDGFDKAKLLWCMSRFKTYGFNSLSFDMPVVVGYGRSHNADASWAYQFAQDIIEREGPNYETLAEYGLSCGWDDDYKANHYDIMDVAFGKHSLKYYAAVLGLPELQDLPYAHGTTLTEAQMGEVFRYCIKDCYATLRLREALEGPLEIRREFGARYGLDMRSMKDAKVAESMLIRDYELKMQKKPQKPYVPSSFSIPFKVPSYISFKSDDMRALVNELNGMEFWVTGGKLALGAMEGRVVKIAGNSYKMGVGGLHSQESRITHRGNDEIVFIDCDVTSYYPSLLLRNGYYPPALGKQMLRTYQGFLDQRVEAKREKNSLIADGLKIPLNATFGKLGEQHSTIFAPEMFLNITLSGQLGLLTLIERLTLAGFEVVSANTDGVVSKVPRKRLDAYREVLRDWENATGFGLEETHYRAIFSRDVNSYIAIYDDNSKVKAKGAYSSYGLSSLQAKVPSQQIVKDAVVSHLWKGTDVSETIRSCESLLEFTVTRNVKGGGFYEKRPLGRVVRFYYSGTSQGKITKADGSAVSEAYNVTPCMDMPDEIPRDLSYATYISRAHKILANDFTSPQYFGDLLDCLG